MNIPRKFRVDFNEEAEMAKIAQAILATSRHVLTGMEMDMLEKIATIDGENWEESLELTIDNIQWFYSLQTEFSREIAKWKDDQ
jgi:hypothetical protein